MTASNQETRGSNFFEGYVDSVEKWTKAVRPLRDKDDPSAIKAKHDLLTELYTAPDDLAPELPRFIEDLRIWQDMVETVAPPPSGTVGPGVDEFAAVATATVARLQARVKGLRTLSIALAALVLALVAAWLLAVQRDARPAIAALAVVLVAVSGVLAFCLTAAYGRRRTIAPTATLGVAALIAPGVVGMTFWNGAVDAFGSLLVVGGVLLVLGAGLWFTTLPAGATSIGRLRLMQHLTDELWPPRRAAPQQSDDTAVERAPRRKSGDPVTLVALLDELDEEIAARERAYQRATRTWQAAQIVLASLASLSAGAAGVVIQAQKDQQLWATVLAASAAALSGLVAALNPGKRQEDSRLTALGAQALRREIRVLREHDIRHDDKVPDRIREALEDLTVRFEAILGRPGEPTFWRRNHPEQKNR